MDEEGHGSASQGREETMSDFWSLATKVVDAEIGKFTIFFLMVFFIVNARANKKLQTDLLKLLTDNISDVKRSFDEVKKEISLKIESLSESAHRLSDEFLKVKFELMREIDIAKQKLEEKQKAIDELGESNSMVLKLVNEYVDQVKTLKAVSDRFILILNDKKNERNGK